MTVTTVEKITEKLTLMITADLDAPILRAWQLWADPRQLERWWGPPTYPATFVDYDLSPGGVVTYFMTGPEGDQPKGWWRVLEVDAPNRLEFEDGFADENGHPNLDMPTMNIRADLRDRPGGGTRMTIATSFSSLSDMETIIEMGMEEGMAAAIGQMDGLLVVEAS
jgi:uncharacterized protein YndB with AHSA1/START domain